MTDLQQRIKNAENTKELDALRMDCVLDRENFQKNQKLFIKQKNKIRRHGGQLND